MPKRTRTVEGGGGFSEDGASFDFKEPLRVVTEIGRDGRIVIPAAMRAAMGVKDGSKLVLLMKGELLEVFTIEAGVRKAQAILKEFIPPGVSLADELIADRRREQAKEDLA